MIPQIVVAVGQARRGPVAAIQHLDGCQLDERVRNRSDQGQVLPAADLHSEGWPRRVASLENAPGAPPTSTDLTSRTLGARSVEIFARVGTPRDSHRDHSQPSRRKPRTA